LDLNVLLPHLPAICSVSLQRAILLSLVRSTNTLFHWTTHKPGWTFL